MSYYARRALLLMTPSHSAPRTSKKRKEPPVSAHDDPSDAPPPTATSSAWTSTKKNGNCNSNAIRFSQSQSTTSLLSQSNSNAATARNNNTNSTETRWPRYSTNGSSAVSIPISKPMLLSQPDASTVHTVTTQDSLRKFNLPQNQQNPSQQQSSSKRSWISAAMSVMLSNPPPLVLPHISTTSSKRQKGNHDSTSSSTGLVDSFSSSTSDFSQWNHNHTKSVWTLSQEQWNALEEMVQSHTKSLNEFQTKLLEPNNILDETIQRQYEILQKPVTQACHRAIQSSTLKLQNKVQNELDQLKHTISQQELHLQKMQQQYDALKQEHVKIVQDYKSQKEICHQIVGDCSRDTLTEKIQDVLNVTVPLLERNIARQLMDKLYHHQPHHYPHPNTSPPFHMHPMMQHTSSWNRTSLETKTSTTSDIPMVMTPMTPFPLSHWNPHYSMTPSAFPKNNHPSYHHPGLQESSTSLHETKHVTPMPKENRIDNPMDKDDRRDPAVRPITVVDAKVGVATNNATKTKDDNNHNVTDVVSGTNSSNLLDCADPSFQKKHSSNDAIAKKVIQHSQTKSLNGSNSSISSNNSCSTWNTSLNRMNPSNKENDQDGNILDVLPCQVDSHEPNEINGTVHNHADDDNVKGNFIREHGKKKVTTMPPLRARNGNGEQAWNSKKAQSRVDSITRPIIRRSSRLALPSKNTETFPSTNRASVAATQNLPVTNFKSFVQRVTPSVTVTKETTITADTKAGTISKAKNKLKKRTPTDLNQDKSKNMNDLNDNNDDYCTPVILERKQLSAPKAKRTSRKKKRHARSVSPLGFQEQYHTNHTTSDMEWDLDDDEHVSENPPLMKNPNATVKNGLLLRVDNTTTQQDKYSDGTKSQKRLEIANSDNMPTPALPDFDHVYNRFRSRRRKLVDPRLDDHHLGKDDKRFSSGVFDFEF